LGETKDSRHSRTKSASRHIPDPFNIY
jgi:hypothetical protein